MKILLNVEFLGRKHQNLQFLRTADKLFFYQKYHTLQCVQKQILLKFIYRVDQNLMNQLILNFLLVVKLLDILHRERDAQNCLLYHRLGLKTLYNTQMYPPNIARDMIMSKY